MINLLIVFSLTLFIATGYGCLLNKFLEFKNNDFVMPVGFAVLICFLQLLYYPAQLFNLSSDYIHVVSIIVYIIGLYLSIRNIREIIKEYLNIRTIIIFVSFAMFLFIFYNCYIDIDNSDSNMYLNYMAQNINIDHINTFNLWTGELSGEWDTIYSFQGYYHFGSFLSWLVNLDYYQFDGIRSVENITVFTWTLGMIYSFVSSMLIYNFVNYFETKKFYKYIILIFGFFYLNFFYWRVAFSYYGNTFRTIYTCALIFYLLRYFKEEQPLFKYICIIIGFAGIAFSSSFLFIGFAVMYALMVYMFKKKETGSISEMADFVIPIIIYALALFSKDNFKLFIVCGALVILYFLFRRNNSVVKITNNIERTFHKYPYAIFVIGMFVLLSIGGAIYYFLINPGYEYNYVHYFEKHSDYDMIKDFFFVGNLGFRNNLVNLMRWVGVGCCLFVKNEDETIKWIKHILIVLFVVFLNPLVTIMIAKTMASNVYYRTFDVVFNPFTEMFFMVLIVNTLDKYKVPSIITKVGITGFVAYMTFTAHYNSFQNEYGGEYGYYVNRNVLPKYKVPYYEYDAIVNFRDIVQRDDYIKVVSHAQTLRTYMPNAYMLFTAYQNYYPWSRINDEFYWQGRKHYGWEKYPEIDYSSSCEYIRRFDVDYALVEWHDNWDFDTEVSKCGNKIYENDVYRIYDFKNGESYER